ncbi:MAG: hypothetical protein R3B47_03060 [Bacteroidia bacterium]
MHDGRFATLEEVVEHYSTGVQDHPNLDAPLRTPPPPQMVQLLNRPSRKKCACSIFAYLIDSAMLADEMLEPVRLIPPAEDELALDEVAVHPNPFSEILNVNLPNLTAALPKSGCLRWGPIRFSVAPVAKPACKSRATASVQGLYWLDVRVGEQRIGKSDCQIERLKAI